MKEQIVNWFVDTMARTEILDLYFIITDLIDFPESQSQKVGQAVGDAMARRAAAEAQIDPSKPLGKQVF